MTTADELPWALEAELMVEERTTDEEGYLVDWRGGTDHVAEDEVPDNAHWKGWVW